MIRTLIVDDQKLIRQGLKALLELDPDIKIVGSARDGQSAIELVEALNPDIVLIDIRMPGVDGVTATRIICERFPSTKVIVLSGYDNESFLADTLHLGAKGYLLKDTAAEELVNVIRAVDKGYSQIGPGLLEKITHKIAASSSIDRRRALESEKPEEGVNGSPGISVLKSENWHHNSIERSIPFEPVTSSGWAREDNFSESPAFKYEITHADPADLLLDSNSLSPQLPAFEFLEVQVESQLSKFEPKALQEVVRLATEQGMIAELLAYINQLLKDNLNNLAALYLTGMLWATSEQENQPLALYYLKLGFQAGLKQGLPCEDLLWFYQAGVSLEASEAFSWLTQVNAPWNNEDGLYFLVQEADRLFGIASMQYRSLLALWQIRAIRALSNKCVALYRKDNFLRLEQMANLQNI